MRAGVMVCHVEGQVAEEEKPEVVGEEDGGCEEVPESDLDQQQGCGSYYERKQVGGRLQPPESEEHRVPGVHAQHVPDVASNLWWATAAALHHAVRSEPQVDVARQPHERKRYRRRGPARLPQRSMPSTRPRFHREMAGEPHQQRERYVLAHQAYRVVVRGAGRRRVTGGGHCIHVRSRLWFSMR